MLIQELSREASLELLTRARLGRLGCTQGTQPYVVPIYFVYTAGSLYSFATIGRKIEWMRANPLVCVEVDEVVSSQQWMSVVAFGRYEELPDEPGWQDVRAFALKVLQQTGLWWEPAYVKTILGGAPRPLVPVFYRIHLDKITGHCATPDPAAPSDRRRSVLASDKAGWRDRLLRQIRAERRRRAR